MAETRDAGAWRSVKQHMAIEETDLHEEAAAFPTAWTVDPLEAERLVESLKAFDVEQIGSSAWMAQHEVMERLNRQCHQSAASNSDE